MLWHRAAVRAGSIGRSTEIGMIDKIAAITTMAAKGFMASTYFVVVVASVCTQHVARSNSGTARKFGWFCARALIYKR